MKNIIKNLFIALVSILILNSAAWAHADARLPANSSANQDSTSVSKYPEKMNQFGKLTEYQTKAFADYATEELAHRMKPDTLKVLRESVKSHNQATWKEVRTLQDLYRGIFLERTASKEARGLLVDREASLSIAVHRQLLYLHDFINESLKSKNSSLDSLALKLSQNMNAITKAQNEGVRVKVPPSMGINQVLQAGKNMPGTVCSLLMGFCTRRSMSTLMDSLNESSFLRSQNFTYEGIEKANDVLAQQKKAVFILIGNHDQPMMDIALGRKVGLQLKSDQHITMTRKSVYPIPPPESAGDVVFVVDNDPKANPVKESVDIVTKNILNSKKDRVSLAIYPEGMLPYTGGQMPMTSKEGAFVIARKLSTQLAAQGIPVYLVQMKTNIIEHLTATENIPAKVKIEFVEKVPNTALQKGVPDTWVEAKRVQAENSFNSHRGESQIDIFNLDKVPSSKIPYGLEMRSCSKVFIF